MEQAPQEEIALWQQQDAVSFQDHLMMAAVVKIKVDVHQTTPGSALPLHKLAEQETCSCEMIEKPTMSSGMIDSHLCELGIRPIIMAAVHRLACKYATSGIEGVKKGHIFVVGDPSRNMQMEFEDHLIMTAAVPKIKVSHKFVKQEMRPCEATEALAMSSGMIDSHLRELGVRPIIMAAVHRLARKYATSGLEGVKKGHIFIVGNPRRIMQMGLDDRPRHAFVKGGFKGDRFGGGWQRVTVQENPDIVMKELNHDGMTVIDGQTGIVMHNNVFSRIISERFQGGGARAAASAGLADAARCIAVMVSEDPPPPLGLVRTFLGSDTHYIEEHLHHGHIVQCITHSGRDPVQDQFQTPCSSPRSFESIHGSPASTVTSEGSLSQSEIDVS